MSSNLPRIASRDEWLAARKALLAKEKEMTRARDALCAERRRLPMVDIDKPYVFEGPAGAASLIDLFEGPSQLIVGHFMFHPDWTDATATASSTPTRCSPAAPSRSAGRTTSSTSPRSAARRAGRSRRGARRRRAARRPASTTRNRHPSVADRLTTPLPNGIVTPALARAATVGRTVSQPHQEDEMAYIMVTADRPDGGVSTPIHTERVERRDLESEHFSAQLLERLGWALTDAEEASRDLSPR